MPVTPAIGRMRQEDRLEFEASLAYIVRSRPAHTTEQDLVSTPPSAPPPKKMISGASLTWATGNTEKLVGAVVH